MQACFIDEYIKIPNLTDIFYWGRRYNES